MHVYKMHLRALHEQEGAPSLDIHSINIRGLSCRQFVRDFWPGRRIPARPVPYDTLRKQVGTVYYVYSNYGLENVDACIDLVKCSACADLLPEFYEYATGAVNKMN